MNFFPDIFGQKKNSRGQSSTQSICELILDGVSIRVVLRPNARAKRIILRMDKKGGGIVLTLPPRTSKKRALEFAASQGVWIAGQLARRPQHTAFAAGATFPFRGVDFLIAGNDTRRTPVWVEEITSGSTNVAFGDRHNDQHILNVSGASEHHERRIKDWLKKQARCDLTKAAHYYADEMNVAIKRISVRDTNTRWGSCSSDGSLSFSWRLILAPSFVLDYVCAHEAAHLIEMNHSPNFWALVDAHCPHTQKAKKWLKSNGASLHTYGS